MHENLLLKTMIVNGFKNNQQQDIRCIFLGISLLAMISIKTYGSKKPYFAGCGKATKESP